MNFRSWCKLFRNCTKLEKVDAQLNYESETLQNVSVRKTDMSGSGTEGEAESDF
jgi:hypothetical protein